MYVYVYGSFLENKKHLKTLTEIETRITDLGMSGKIIRLSQAANPKSLLVNEIRRGAKTIVAVGDDLVFNLLIETSVDYSIPLGVVPIEKLNNSIARSLGITGHTEACDALAARRIEILDLGKINSYYFITHVKIESKGAVMTVPGKYSISIDESGLIYVINLATEELKKLDIPFTHPQDSMLDIAITTNTGMLSKKKKSLSLFSFTKFLIENNKPFILSDGRSVSGIGNFEIKPRAIKVIAGKQRIF